MKPYDERLQYYLTMAHLLSEADLQLEADAEDPGSAPYGEALAELRAAVELALVSCVRITGEVQTLRSQTAQPPAAPGVRMGKH